MTCIIGLEQEGRVYIGADRFAGHAWLKTVTPLSKVIENGRFLIGYAGSFRAGQIAEHSLHVPLQEEDVSDLEYLTTTFVGYLRSALRHAGNLEKKDEVEQGLGNFLLAYKNHLYNVDENFAVLPEAMSAIGSGFLVAYGAMEALSGMEPESRLRRALEITAQYSPYVIGPFVVKMQGTEVLPSDSEVKTEGNEA